MKTKLITLILALLCASQSFGATRSVTSFPVITPVDADYFIFTDTSNSGLFSKATLANTKTALGIPDGTVTNQIRQWNGSSWESVTSIAGLIDPTAGDGDVDKLLSADTIFDLLALKQDVGGGSLSVSEQPADPVASEMTTGQLIVATASGDMFYKSETGLYTFAGSFAADPVAPTLTSTTVGSAGLVADLLFSESVSIGAGGNAGWSMDCSLSGAIAMTYSSGAGTNTLDYSLADTPTVGEDCTVSYTQPGNGVEATDDTTDIVSLGGATVTNNSTVAAGACTTLSADSLDTGASQSYSVGSTTRYELGSVYTPSSSYDVCKIAINFKKVGTPTSNVTVKIYNVSGGIPTTLLYTSTTSIPAASVTISNAWYEFAFTGASFVSGTPVFIALASDALNTTGNNFLPVYGAVSGTNLQGYTTVWGNVATNQKLNARIYQP